MSLVFIHRSFVHKVTSNKHYNKNRPEKCGKLEELLWENTAFKSYGEICPPSKI